VDRGGYRHGGGVDGEGSSPPLSPTRKDSCLSSTPPHPRFAILPRPSRGGGSHGDTQGKAVPRIACKREHQDGISDDQLFRRALPGFEQEHEKIRSVFELRWTERPKQEHRQMRSPVNRRARELLFSGSRRDGVQQIRFFSYRLVPGALPGMTEEPGSVGRRKIGPVALSGKFMLLIVSIMLLNLNNRKLYNTPRRISAWRAVAGSPVPRPGPQNGHGHLTGLPELISAACRTALPVAGRR